MAGFGVCVRIMIHLSLSERRPTQYLSLLTQAMEVSQPQGQVLSVALYDSSLVEGLDDRGLVPVSPWTREETHGGRPL